jgi:uncharacterized protein YukE
MSFEGMDVDELSGLAKQIDSDARKLYELVSTLSGTLGELTLLWHGPVAATFEQDWLARNRPALLAAYDTLSALSKHLASNIGQQSAASAADGGWSAAGAADGGWPAARVAGDAENVLTGLGLAGFPVSALADTSKFMGVTDGVLTKVGYVGVPISAYRMGQDQAAYDQDITSGRYADAANDLSDEVSDGLKGAAAFVPWPYSLAVYGTAVDVKLLDEVANLDWKDTPNPFSGTNFEQDYVPVFKSMGTGAYWEQAGQTLWGAL